MGASWSLSVMEAILQERASFQAKGEGVAWVLATSASRPESDALLCVSP